MMKLLIAFVATVALAAVPLRSDKADLSIQTSSGMVFGTIDKKYPNVRQFLGIPFAQAPEGDLRWEVPRKLGRDAIRHQINGKSLPPSCPQYLSKRGNSIYTLDVLQFNLQGLNKTGAISENCLKASIWTPTTFEKRELLPVLIFIYGGAFINGGIDVPYQVPTQWVQRSQEHIVVSFNYRVNFFGFPNAKGLEEQNLGLLDQRLAVEWIRDNIKAFGGDPDNMTLWGQSAGAQSVDFYNYAHFEDPIVKGLIMDSGTALLPLRSQDVSQWNFTFVADHFGCKNNDAAEQLACMRRIPFRDIEMFLQQYTDTGISPGLTFTPVVDNKIVFSDYPARARAGKLSKLPAVIGTNAQDGIILVPYPVSDPSAGVSQTAAYRAALPVFYCPAAQTTKLRQDSGRTTFRYSYAGNFSNVAPRGWEGAYHSSELPMLFGTYGDYRGSSTELEMRTSVAMQEAWVAFAKGGVQGLEATGWNAYELGQSTAREFGAGVPVQDTSLADTEKACGL